MFDIAARKSLNLKRRKPVLLPRHPVGPSQRQVCSRFSGRFGPRFRGGCGASSPPFSPSREGLGNSRPRSSFRPQGPLVRRRPLPHALRTESLFYGFRRVQPFPSRLMSKRAGFEIALSSPVDCVRKNANPFGWAPGIASKTAEIAASIVAPLVTTSSTITIRLGGSTGGKTRKDFR